MLSPIDDVPIPVSSIQNWRLPPTDSQGISDPTLGLSIRHHHRSAKNPRQGPRLQVSPGRCITGEIVTSPRNAIVKSDQENSRTVLGQTMIRGPHLKLKNRSITSLELFPNLTNGSHPVMLQQVTHIFEEERIRLMGIKNSHNVKEEISPLVLKPALKACLTKGLARKSSAEDMEFWYPFPYFRLA